MKQVIKMECYTVALRTNGKAELYRTTSLEKAMKVLADVYPRLTYVYTITELNGHGLIQFDTGDVSCFRGHAKNMASFIANGGNFNEYTYLCMPTKTIQDFIDHPEWLEWTEISLVSDELFDGYYEDSKGELREEDGYHVPVSHVCPDDCSF